MKKSRLCRLLLQRSEISKLFIIFFKSVIETAYLKGGDPHGPPPLFMMMVNYFFPAFRSLKVTVGYKVNQMLRKQP